MNRFSYVRAADVAEATREAATPAARRTLANPAPASSEVSATLCRSTTRA